MRDLLTLDTPLPRSGAVTAAAPLATFIGLIFLYAGAWALTAGLFDLPAQAPAGLFVRYGALSLITSACYAGTAAILLRRRDPARLAAHLTSSAVCSAVVTVLAFALLMAVFTAFKSAIPLLRPFAWDAPLAAADRLLHGGDAWRLARPLLESRAALIALALLYGPAWFGSTAAVMGWAAWIRDPGTRLYFFTGYFGLWFLLGTVGALLLSSAGPAYYHIVTGGDAAFAPLLDLLRQNAPWIVQGHEVLWRDSQSGAGIVAGAGISAAPSMHIAQLAFFGFAFRRLHARVSAAFFVLTALTFVATVVLAWHYAVDAYLGVLGAYLVHRGAERIRAKWTATREVSP